jgi:hypothetical protein
VQPFEPQDEAAQGEQCETAEQAEAAVNEPPVKGNTADGPCDQRQQRDAGAGEHAPGEEPLVADWVEPRSDDSGSDDQVAEGQPVCAVGEEWIASAGVGKGVVDANEPTVERWGVLGEIQVLGCADEEGGLVDEREGRDTANNQASDDDGKPEAYGAEEVLWGGCRHGLGCFIA